MHCKSGQAVGDLEVCYISFQKLLNKNIWNIFGMRWSFWAPGLVILQNLLPRSLKAKQAWRNLEISNFCAIQTTEELKYECVYQFIFLCCHSLYSDGHKNVCVVPKKAVIHVSKPYCRISLFHVNRDWQVKRCHNLARVWVWDKVKCAWALQVTRKCFTVSNHTYLFCQSLCSEMRDVVQLP